MIEKIRPFLQLFALKVWFQINRITDKIDKPLCWIEENKIDDYFKKLMFSNNPILNGFVLTLWWEIDWISRYEGNLNSTLTDYSIKKFFKDIINGRKRKYFNRARRLRGEHNFDSECDLCNKFLPLKECTECSGLFCKGCMRTHNCKREMMMIEDRKNLSNDELKKYDLLMNKVRTKGCSQCEINEIIYFLKHRFEYPKNRREKEENDYIIFLHRYKLDIDKIAFVFGRTEEFIYKIIDFNEKK